MAETSDKKSKLDSNMELLIRIDERTQNIVSSIASIKTNYVHKDQFKPVRDIVFGLVALILIGAIGSLLALIFK